MDSLLKALSQWQSFTALVVGDFMLDQLVYGDADRLSADAPVPILRVRRSENRAGGAANVCHDLIAMKARVLGFGVIGDDEEGRILKSTLAGKGVDIAGLIVDRDRPTTLKRSLIGLAQQRHPQKMFRVDHESREPIPTLILDQILAAYKAALPRADVVCIEDYNKGVCTAELCQAVIENARRAGKPVLVDPAAIADYAKYRRATCITPNRNEAELATRLPTEAGDGVGRNAAVSARLLDALSLDCVVLTLDKHGALLHQRDSEPIAIPTVARQVYDVTGAGDMMLAGLAAARANGIPWPSAVRFANTAAGLEVEVFGVEPIPLERIHHQLLLERSGAAGKVRTLDQLLVEVAARRQNGESIVFTNGCFDVLHPGHVTLIEEAAKLGDFLIVAINDDASVGRLKGPGRPVNHQDDRAKVMGALGGVGAVVLFSEDTPERLLDAIGPDVLVKGGDYRPDQVVGREIVESRGGRVEIIPVLEGRSTTATIAKLRAQAT